VYGRVDIGHHESSPLLVEEGVRQANSGAMIPWFACVCGRDGLPPFPDDPLDRFGFSGRPLGRLKLAVRQV
jgi:hypothetical protein